MRTQLDLGPFRLIEPLARGGMASVWRGEHRATGLAAAVKVVDERASDGLVRALEHEVRTVAGLSHPNIIRVYDQGRVPAEVAGRAAGQLYEGSAWFAMELAEAGELGWRDAPEWSFVRTALMDLLDALAHAHANGVLHRDLKPANVLFAASEAGPVLKLTDFGMGWSWNLRGLTPPPRTGGTPLYMAPEQFARNMALQGPWTDLYALGCLAFALVARHPPFPRGSFEQLRLAHQTQPFPEVPARAAAPPGFGEFLRALVAKSPADRWSRAADAAAALRELPDQLDRPRTGGPVPAPQPDVPTQILDLPIRPMAPPGPPRRPLPVPPMAPDWRDTHRIQAAMPPQVGLGLYGLRPIPMVARFAERDLAWELLRAVRTLGPRLLLIEGPSGCGKSRLAEWFAVRAEETGAAVALRVVHGPDGGDRDGLPGLVARHLRIPPRLEHAELVTWVQDAAGVEDLGDPQPLVELLSPLPGRVQPAAAQHAVVERVVRLLSRRRPVVVWIDDAQWGPDALAFAASVLGSDLPVLLVLTVQEEALPDEVAAALNAIRGAPRSRALQLGPLDEEASLELIRRVLGPDRALTDRILERTRGNALFAVQLMGDWVQRGLVVPTADGFGLVPEADQALPASIAQLWDQRSAALLEGRPDDWRFALEIAAVLGPDVDRDEWEATCAIAGISAPVELVDRLVKLRLARVEPGGQRRFAFVHEMLRESVLASARTRAAAWHLAAAQMLGDPAGSNERQGRHLLSGGAWREAIPPVLAGAEHRLRAGQLTTAQQLARALRVELDRHLSPDDPAQGRLLVLESQLWRMGGHFDAARGCAERAVGLSGAPPTARIASLRELATIRLHTETGPSAVFALLEEALALARADAPDLAATVLLERARTEEYYGRLAEAAASYQAAQDLAVDGTEEAGLAGLGLGLVALKEGRLDDAARLVGLALTRFGARELWWHYEYGRMVLGEIARIRGDHQAAETIYRAAITSYERLSGPLQTALPRLNLALVLCATDRYAEAARELGRAVADAERGGHKNLVLMGQAVATWVQAGLGDWRRFDAAVNTSRGLLERGLLDPDFGRCWLAAGDLADRAGEQARARAAWVLALGVWEGLGDTAQAEEVGRRLGPGV